MWGDWYLEKSKFRYALYYKLWIRQWVCQSGQKHLAGVSAQGTDRFALRVMSMVSISQLDQQFQWRIYSLGSLLFSVSVTLRSSFSLSSRMEIRLSRPNKYPSSWLPSTQGLRWLTLTWSGRGFVFPKSIIHTLACPVLSWTNNKELPITYNSE